MSDPKQKLKPITIESFFVKKQKTVVSNTVVETNIDPQNEKANGISENVTTGVIRSTSECNIITGYNVTKDTASHANSDSSY